jgi:hypothetical protein
MSSRRLTRLKAARASGSCAGTPSRTVNEHNTRAPRCLLKCGFVDSGVRVDMIDGVNHETVRSL